MYGELLIMPANGRWDLIRRLNVNFVLPFGRVFQLYLSIRTPLFNSKNLELLANNCTCRLY